MQCQVRSRSGIARGVDELDGLIVQPSASPLAVRMQAESFPLASAWITFCHLDRSPLPLPPWGGAIEQGPATSGRIDGAIHHSDRHLPPPATGPTPGLTLPVQQADGLITADSAAAQKTCGGGECGGLHRWPPAIGYRCRAAVRSHRSHWHWHRHTTGDWGGDATTELAHGSHRELHQ